MERKKILIIGMFDSIHLARWLEQFESDKLDFILMPSKKFKRYHFKLSRLIKSTKEANFSVVWPYKYFNFAGYFDFILSKVFSFMGLNSKEILLKKVLRKYNFDFIHAFEIQGAGYLYELLPERYSQGNHLILTNWGSDISFFINLPEHKNRIIQTIKKASYYSAECERDYHLATKYGFKGKFLPCIPNAGGFSDYEINKYRSNCSSRELILCKGYGGTFGRVDLILSGIEKFLIMNPGFRVFFYSVTIDVEPQIKKLVQNFKGQIDFSTVRKPLERTLLLDLFAMARVYIGCSVSDGISTSFLEALVAGAYPIQTKTSCASEWIGKGAVASIVELDTDSIYTQLNRVIFDDKLLDHAQQKNLVLVKTSLNYTEISKLAHTYYGIS